MLSEITLDLSDFPSYHRFFDTTGQRLPDFLTELLEDTPNPLLWPSKLEETLKKQRLGGIQEALQDFPATAEIGSNVYVHASVVVPKCCTICDNTYIGRGVELRPGCYIRGNSIILDGCIIGNSSEIKNALLFEGAQVPHFNYVGDAVLGKLAHLGAGAVLSNYRLDGSNIVVKHFLQDHIELYAMEVNKFSSLLGDGAQVGCNSVMCPGSVLEKGELVGPCEKRSGWRN